MFIGRKNELEILDNLYKSDRFECPVIYGRRRVGKTTLINEFCKGKKAIYFAAIESTMQNNLENLSKNIFEVTMPNFDVMPAFDKLDKLLDYLYDVSKNERIIFVIDEYPYLASTDRSVSSVLQNYIDHKFKDSKLFLILCGSSMSFMENQVLGYKSPLYGRRTAQFKIKPFDYYTSAQFCPRYSNEDKAILYGITGGIPHYLARIDPKKSIKVNIVENFFNPTGYFFEEPANLLKQELREPQIYNAIIEAIAKGASKLNEIATAVGLLTSLCSTYIKSLILLGIVEKEKPILEDNSKKTIYKITDNMFRFWYRFIPNNMTAIVSGNGENVYEKVVLPHMSDYMGNVFEQISIQYLIRNNNANQLPFMFFNIGRWWGNNPSKKIQAEIDIIAIAVEEKKILFGECKYKNEPVDTDVIDKLLENSELIKGYREKYYFIFSKSGFSKKVLETDIGVVLVDLNIIFS